MCVSAGAAGAGSAKLLVVGDGDITFRPIILVQHVAVYRKSFRSVTETRQRTGVSERGLRPLPRGIDSDQFYVFFITVEGMNML
jgi:hypothetical protein